ncbi:Probable 3-phenylpropionic acid transporter [hydrothermal vent metagenome]|uniref:Probable 3-phenylpropionic acid transporter n=1 Tax=hydrothermal vent metagenome TaxID=652676 RepID=A0A1W1CEH7_9ZZZZ
MQSKISIEIPLALYYLFYFSLVAVYIIFMPKSLLEFNYNNIEVGIIYASAPFMRFIIPFVFRRFITLDHKVFVISLFLSLISTIMFLGTVENFWLYLFANLLFGASMGISLPYVETISLHTLSKSRYGKIRLYGSIGFMLTALWLGQVLTSPYQAIYYLISFTLLTAIFGTMIIYYDQDTKIERTDHQEPFSLIKYPWFWISIFLMQVSFGGFYNFFTIYETSHGISLEMTSWMWSFGVVCEIIMLYFQGSLLQKNLLTIIQFAIIITVIRWLILYLYPNSITMIFISQSLHAITFALYHTASISYVFSIYTQKKLAQQFFLGIAFGLGGSVGALLAGQIYGESMFLIEALIALLSFVAIFKHKNRNNF